MSSFMSDMSRLGRISPVKLDLMQQKSRSGAKTMNLDPNKLTTYKLSIKKLRKNKGTTKNNLNTKNHT
jgi:hypothetical protein